MCAQLSLQAHQVSGRKQTMGALERRVLQSKLSENRYFGLKDALFRDLHSEDSRRPRISQDPLVELLSCIPLLRCIPWNIHEQMSTQAPVSSKGSDNNGVFGKPMPIDILLKSRSDSFHTLLPEFDHQNLRWMILMTSLRGTSKLFAVVWSLSSKRARNPEGLGDFQTNSR